MRFKLFVTILAIAILAVGAAACKGGPAADSGGQATTGEQVSGGSGANVAPGAEGAQGADTGSETPVLQVASGTMPAVVTEAPPSTPVPSSDRQVVTIADAQAKVPFTILEPNDLPDEAHRDIVFVEEPLPDQESANLPAVRMVYSLQPKGMITVIESPATGAEGNGEAIDINGNQGWIEENGAIVIEWEQGGVRFQVRGNADRDTLLKAARSMGEVVDKEKLP